MKTTSASLTDRMLEMLDHVQVDLETFRVQAALGRMDAADAFEDLKAEFRSIIHRAGDVVDRTSARAAALRAALEHLRVQLELGRAELADRYAEQKNRLLHSIGELEHLVNWDEMNNPVTGRPLRHDLERLKLRLELLRLQYELRKLDSEEEWKNRIVGVVEHWKVKIAERREEWDRHSSFVIDEMQKVYDHLRKALAQV
ncbi:MAG: hypothetical protein ACK5XV_06230 [Flavobacteriales bacterium]|jgi:hypothetical protein